MGRGRGVAIRITLMKREEDGYKETLYQKRWEKGYVGKKKKNTKKRTLLSRGKKKRRKGVFLRDKPRTPEDPFPRLVLEKSGKSFLSGEGGGENDAWSNFCGKGGDGFLPGGGRKGDKKSRRLFGST